MNRLSYFTLLAAVVSSTAFATKPPWEYRIILTSNMGGLDITAHTFVGPAVTVGLENHSDRTASCTASFVSYPHTPSRDELVTASIPAGKRAVLAYPLEKLGANISTVFVDLTCSKLKPAP